VRALRLGSTLLRPTNMGKQSSEQDVDDRRAIVTTSGQRGKKNVKTMIFDDKNKISNLQRSAHTL